MIAYVLVIIGGLNWLLVGLGVGDVVAYLGSTLATIIYILVGLSAILLIFAKKQLCDHAGSAPAQM
jgi:uncharacterized membrane protein YuzA (DUF378 family)